MPATQEVYGKLLSDVRPAVIESAAEYDTVSGRLSDMVRKGRKRTREETRLMRLLAVLVRDYDQRVALPPAGMRPAEALGYLLKHSGRTPAHLRAVFGQRSHVNEALNGKRKISAEQARKLGRMFSVNPGLFI